MSEDLACRDVVELLTAYLDGALDSRTEADVRRHLAECDGCDRYLEQLQFVVDELGRSATEEESVLPEAMVAELTAAFHATFPRH